MKVVAHVFLCAVLGVMGCLSAAWAVITGGRGDYPTAVVVSCVAIFCFAFVAVLVLTATGTVAPRVEFDDEGTTFRPGRTVDALSIITTFAAFAAAVLYSVFTPLGMLDISGPRGNGHYLAISIFASLLGLPSLWQIFTKGGFGYLRLTADGYEHGDGYSSAARAWDDVTDVADRPSKGRRRVTSGATFITTADGRTRVVATNYYTPNGDALRRLLRYYWREPDARDELTDGRAVRRLENLDIWSAV